MHELVRKAWTAIGVNTSVKGVERALYMEHYRNGDMEVGQWGWDRASAIKADPGRWLGTIDDGPWAPTYGHWYDQNALQEGGAAPGSPDPQDLGSLGEDAGPSRTRRRATPTSSRSSTSTSRRRWRSASVGENVSPWIVKNNFRNVQGRASSTTTRSATTG